MPRQTAEKEYIFPDGFQLAVNVGDGWEDVGLLAGGAVGTLNWDMMMLDGGNYQEIIKKARNFTFQLAPSAIWNWDLSIFNKIFGGVTDISSGDLINKAAHQVDLSTIDFRLTHFDGVFEKTLTADDITALTVDTVDEYVVVNKTLFPGTFDWTIDIDSLVNISGWTETDFASLNTTGAQGKFYAGPSELSFIYEAGTFADLAAAKAALAGTVVRAYTSIDWQFTFYNATIDSGAAFTFKGVNEDGVNELSVGFTAQPDPSDGYKLMKMFKA